MSDAGTVRFGLAAARELEIEVEGAAEVAAGFEKALEGGAAIYWVEDTGGHSHGIVVSQVAFLEVESHEERDVGFG